MRERGTVREGAGVVQGPRDASVVYVSILFFRELGELGYEDGAL